MINRVIDFSVQHKLAVLAVIAIACIGGWWSMVTLPLDATPDLSDTQVIIIRTGTAARTSSRTR